LLRFGIGFPDPLPQPFQCISTRLWAESVIGAQSLHNGLNDIFLKIIRSSVPFPVIEHFGKSADDGAVAVSVLVFETEEFT
jgi:hypothetical protein